METPMAVVVLVAHLLLLLPQMTKQEHFAQECRVYHLQSGIHHATPYIPVNTTLAVSFYNRNESDFPKNIHVILQGDTASKSIHIRGDGEVSLGNLWSDNRTVSPTCRNSNTWLTLALLLHDQNIIGYWIDNRESYISSKASLGSNITARVTTSEPSVHVTLNCPAGCLLHDKNSTLIGREMLLIDNVTIYTTQDEGEANHQFRLGFRNSDGQFHIIKLDIGTWDKHLWHKLVIYHDKDKKVFVSGNGITRGEMSIMKENVTFTILNSTTALFSLHCYPDHAQGLKGWGSSNINITESHSHEEEEEEDDGAGVGQVLAWVLVGLALFLVMVMALLLCSKTSSRNNSMDYAGASVGVVGSFGRQMTFRNGEREAGTDMRETDEDDKNCCDECRIPSQTEEDTEPDSPTFVSPVIHHKVPEEEDEHQSNTKML